MLWYVARRLIAMILTFWAMTFVTFLIMELPPGDFASTRLSEMAATGVKMDAAMIEKMREFYRLDEPVLVRYWHWFTGVLQGDFGFSMAHSMPVLDLVGEQLPNTLLVEGATLVFMWLAALPIGIYSAVRQYSVGDYAATVLGFIGLAVPNFLLALIIMWIGYAYFGVMLGGLNSPDYINASASWEKAKDTMLHLWAPVLVTGTAGMAQLIRVMRANLLDEMHKPYVMTARAKGLAEWKLILKYPVRIAVNPIVSSMGWVLPNLISASLIVAVVMNLPTLGPLLLNALMIQDMYLAGGVLLMMAILTLVGTLISDLLLYWLDPRIRAGAKG